MKILIKFPTRERPERFYKVLQGYIENSIDPGQTRYVITLDSDDPRLNQYLQVQEQVKEEYPDLAITWNIGKSTGKINAVNRDMDEYVGWDILLLASDDMVCQQKGWDEVIRENMINYYPDTDGVLFFSDGHQNLNTMPILGFKYFKRFGYIYHPDYISLWCDNEFQDVADKLNRQTRFEDVLFEHQIWFNGKEWADTKDELSNKEQKFYSQDKQTFEKHKKLNFGL